MKNGMGDLFNVAIIWADELASTELAAFEELIFQKEELQSYAQGELHDLQADL